MMSAIQELLLSASNSPAVSIIGKATVVLALALVGASIARHSRAAMRHAVLAAAFAVLLVLPAASILGPAIRIALPVTQPERAVTAVAQAIPVATQIPPGLPASQPRLSIAASLLAIWIAGTALVLARVLVGLWQVNSVQRSALPWARGRLVVEQIAPERRVDVLLHEELPGPMTCGTLRPVIVLPVEAEGWEAEDLQRAMVHELEHVRRGDWVIQSMARAVCALYWFHPLVWTGWRRLTLEAERACDDAVLGCSEATAYADQLVGLAERLSSLENTPLLAMAKRSDLATRVGAVLDSRQQRGRAGTLPLALSCAAAVALVFTVAPFRLVAAPPPPVPAIEPVPITQAESSSVAAPGPATVAPPAEQTPAPSTAPAAQTVGTFAARSELVIVSATVTDLAGKSIDGLGARDFVLMEDGVPQTISTFEFHALPVAPDTPNAPVSYYVLGYYPKNAKTDGQFRRIQVIDKNDTTATVKYRNGYYPKEAFLKTGDKASPAEPKAALPPGTTPPVLIYKREPEYSEEARKAKYQGNVGLSVTVDETGAVTGVRVVRSLGLGLDEKAIEAVKQWKFKPGTVNGTPSAMETEIQVGFRLL